MNEIDGIYYEFTKKNIGFERDFLTFKLFENEKQIDMWEYELLKPNTDFAGGLIKNPEQKTRRRSRLKDAGQNVWQMGIYFPHSKFPEKHKTSDLAQHIIKNKTDDSSSGKIALGMYLTAKERNFEIFNVDYIVPIPNFRNENVKAVSIANALSNIINEKEKKIIPVKKVLIKTRDIDTKGMTQLDKDKFFEENQIYQFSPTLDIRGKTILLVDDIVTSGNAAKQCMAELKKAGVNQICFYCATTTF